MVIELDKADLYCGDLPTRADPAIGVVLVSGATGYIGGRLVPELLARGYRVRVMVRMASHGQAHLWPDAEIVVADALKPQTLVSALVGVHTAYYLIHSLLLGPRQFEAADIEAARNFRQAAENNGVKRIIYLGGLGDTGSELSPHLRSRVQVSQELQSATVPLTILRAAIIIGSGSASYEIIKHLVKNAPIMPVPSWARTRCQPIAVRDVVKYLVGVLETPQSAGKSYDIGGTEVLTYEEMLRTQAAVMGRKIIFLYSPLSSIRVYSYLASLITPVPHSITRCLMESIFHEVVCQDTALCTLIPFPLLSLRESLVRALSREEQDRVSTRWSDAYPPAHELAIKLHELKTPPRYHAVYSMLSAKRPSVLFRAISCVGGRNGWFENNWMWNVRGWIDRLILGIGTSRGRRSNSTLRINDVIDFWRVEGLIEDHKLLLRAEMKMPGMAWLQFTIHPEGGQNRIVIEAFYAASTLAGHIYWHFFLPFHYFIFKGLLRQIEARS